MARSGVEGREIDCSRCCSHSQSTDDKVYGLQSKGRSWRDKKQMSGEELWMTRTRSPDETEARALVVGDGGSLVAGVEVLMVLIAVGGPRARVPEAC
jgi:hypothetical protein